MTSGTDSMCSSISTCFSRAWIAKRLVTSADQPGKIETLSLHGDRRHLAAREVEQIVGELPHPRALFEDRLQQFAALRI